MTDIVLAGSIIADNVKMIPEWPGKGMLVPITSVGRALGGSVPNSGIDLKTLDPSLAVVALGKVGDDEAGDFAIRTLTERGLDVSRVTKVPGVATSFTDVMTVSSTGERTFFNHHGADSRLVPDDIDPKTLDCRIFHLAYLLLLDGIDAPDPEYGTAAARILAGVQAAGIKTSIDIVSEQSERFARIVRASLKYVDYAVINEIEAERATGEKDLRKAAERLLELGVRERVVIHCPEGSLTVGRDGSFASVGSLVLPDGWIVGSVGAGDAFCAGMLYSFLRGLDPEEGMRLASCAAACNLRVADATSGAKGLEETRALERRFPRRAF